MIKKTRLVTAFLLVAILPALLLLPGCPFHMDSLYGLKVTGDGNGGGIAIYEEGLGGNIYIQSSDGMSGAIVAWGVGKGFFSSEKAFVQRVDASGNLLWGALGIELTPH